MGVHIRNPVKHGVVSTLPLGRDVWSSTKRMSGALFSEYVLETTLSLTLPLSCFTAFETVSVSRIPQKAATFEIDSAIVRANSLANILKTRWQMLNRG